MRGLWVLFLTCVNPLSLATPPGPLAADTSETLYAAFEPTAPGRKHTVYQWSLPDASHPLVPQRRVSDSTPACMAPGCGRHFGLLEPRRWCAGCGGAFCGSHALQVEFFEQRYCEICLGRLGEASELGLVGRSRMGSRANSLDPSRVQSAAGSRRPSVSGVGGGVGGERERGRAVSERRASTEPSREARSASDSRSRDRSRSTRLPVSVEHL